MATRFDDVDFPTWLSGSRESAGVVVPLLVDGISPRSVVDVGCGLGAWLAVFAEHGVDEVLGLDGPWVDRRLLEVAPTAFRAVDLGRPSRARATAVRPRTLPRGRTAPRPVARRTTRAFAGPALRRRRLLAAIPGQGGLGHVNEQWPRYWAERFATHSYVATDPIRLRVWEEPDVKWWFAQNMTCYVAVSALPRFPMLQTHVCETTLRCPSCIPSVSGRPLRGRPSRRHLRARRAARGANAESRTGDRIGGRRPVPGLAQLLVRLLVEPHPEERELGAGDQEQRDEHDRRGRDLVVEEDPRAGDDEAEQRGRASSSASRARRRRRADGSRGSRTSPSSATRSP